MKGEIEIARFHHAEPLVIAEKVLSEAGVPFRRSNDSLTSDVAFSGRGSNAACILLVPAPRAEAAHMALLDAARSEVASESSGLDHPMQSFSDEELLAVLREPAEWSHFDLALAEHVLRQRAITPPPIEFSHRPVPPDATDPPQIEEEEIGDGNRRASALTIACGYIFATLTGSLWGIIIALLLLFSTERGDDGKKRYSYDQRSRDHGLVLLLYACIVLVAFWFWIASMANL